MTQDLAYLVTSQKSIARAAAEALAGAIRDRQPNTILPAVTRIKAALDLLDFHSFVDYEDLCKEIITDMRKVLIAPPVKKRKQYHRPGRQQS